MISLLVAIVVYVLSSYSSLNVLNTEKKDTLGVNSNITVKTSTTSTPVPTSSNSPLPSNSEEPSTTPESTQTNNLGIDEWIYPGASVTSKSGASLSLETGDNTESVTDWYKEKVREKGFNAKSFVTTKTNDNVLNKLSGAKEGQEVLIEIKKAPSETSAKITVTLE